jgi:hypothetical protein
MPGILPRLVTGKDNSIIVEETIRCLSGTSTVREAEKDRLREQIEEIEQQMSDIVSEYSTFLVVHNLIEPGVDPMTVIQHAVISEFYDEPVADGATYVDNTQVLINNPSIPSQLILQNEADQMLGKLTSEILRYQNDINKKFSMKKSLLKRLYDLDYRENSPMA